MQVKENVLHIKKEKSLKNTHPRGISKNYLKEKVHLCIYIMTDSGTVIEMCASFI